MTSDNNPGDTKSLMLIISLLVVVFIVSLWLGWRTKGQPSEHTQSLYDKVIELFNHVVW
ncbi:hypothetical protein [Veronia pacifica]|uniref:hypothetical protein n=1 Tax=Veronia pacifica TaxID=1080227 RepID=UPI001585F473|nr:hypothetical protein [Veronia pacifica]